MPSIQEILRMLFEPRRLETRQPVLTPGAQRTEITGSRRLNIPGMLTDQPSTVELPLSETRRGEPVLAERVISTTIAPPVLAALGDFFTALNDPRLAAQQSGGRVLQAERQLETGRRLAIDQSQLELTAAEMGDVADARAEGRRLQRADFGLRARGQALDERRFKLESDKFEAATQAAAKKLRLDLGNHSELAAASVLAQLGVDTDDEAAVRRALADPRTLASIGRAARRLKPDAAPKELRTLSERLASRFFDPQRDAQRYSELVLEIERELRTTGSDDVSERAALNAERINLSSLRTALMVQIRGLDTFVGNSKDKADANRKATALRREVADINAQMQEIISQFRARGEEGGRRLQLAPTDTPEEGGRRLSIDQSQLSEQERARVSNLIGAFGGPLPPQQQGRALRSLPPEGQATAGMVKIRDVDGQVWEIPAEKLQEALARGATRIP